MQTVIGRNAGKVLVRMQPAKAKDIREAVYKVAADPTARNNKLRPLKGVLNGFRISVGASLRSNRRVLFTLDRQGGVMSIFEIAPRGGAYR